MTWLTVTEYVPLVISTPRSFPHALLITGLVTILTRRMPLVEEKLPTLPEHLSSCCSIFRFLFCGSFFLRFFWPLYYLSFDLRILIIPLVSSNSFYVICYKLPILTWPFYFYAVRSNICSMVALPFTIYKFVLFND